MLLSLSSHKEMHRGERRAKTASFDFFVIDGELSTDFVDNPVRGFFLFGDVLIA
jgi:hypothetical protein